MPATSRPLTPQQSAALRDPRRLAALERTGLMDSPREAAFDRLTRLAAGFLQAPLALVNLVDDHRQFSKSCFAPSDWPPERTAPMADSFCKWPVLSRQTVAITDARADERVNASAMLDLGVIAYLGAPLVLSDGNVLGTLCVTDDRPREWTEREIALIGDLAAAVVTEVELRLHVEERARIERIKDELVSVVAHELRTPLTAIRGSLGLLATGRLDPAGDRARKMISVAAESSERLVRLVNEMLDLERLEAGAAQMHPAPVAAGELLRRAAACVAETPEGRRVKVSATADPELVLQVDPDRIVQVLVNIGANAARYSDEGGSVEMIAERRGTEALLSVKDRGRGIPPDKLEAIFERFTQADSTDARERGGVGLGLAICRTIVRQHGGLIWVASELGRGSTFFFTVPASE